MAPWSFQYHISPSPMTSYVIVSFDLARFAAVPAFVAQKVRHRSVKVLVRIGTKNGVVAVRVQLQERDGIPGFVYVYGDGQVT